MARYSWFLITLVLFAGVSELHAQTVITAPSNPVIGVAAIVGSSTSSKSIVASGNTNGQNMYPSSESPNRAIDTLLNGKYLNFGKTGVGFIVTPIQATVLNGFRFATGNDAIERDPLTITIEGTKSRDAIDTLDSAWTLLYDGDSGLATNPGRNTYGIQELVPNTEIYFGNRILVQSLRSTSTANSMQFAEIQLLGAVVPEPTTWALIGLTGVGVVGGWYQRRRRNVQRMNLRFSKLR